MFAFQHSYALSKMSYHSSWHSSKAVLILCVVGLLPAYCLANRRREESFSSFSTLGRFAVTNERLPFLRKSTNAASRHIHDASILNLYSMDLPSTFPEALEVQPAARVKRKTKRATIQENNVEEESPGTAVRSRKELSIELSQPLISQEAWDLSTGSEWDEEDAVETLTKSGLQLCKNPSDENVEWTPHPSAARLLEEHNNDKDAILKDGNVLVYVGKIQKENVVGAGLPMIKTESIVPLHAQDMANLLMDSEKVKIYNKMSLGRTDVKKIDPFTKIVRNITKPPVAKSSMVSVTLMHARPLQQEDNLSTGFVVVSRAVPGMVGEDFEDMPRNDILMGVNVLQDRGEAQECLMTAVTHVYSPALPKMLAKSMGVSSAVNFVRDIREACK